MRQLTKRTLAIVLFVVAVALSVAEAVEFIRIDKCLDSGGRWDYSTGSCEGESAR